MELKFINNLIQWPFHTKTIYLIELNKTVYNKQLDGIKIHQQLHPVAIPYKNDLSHRVKQELYIKQWDGVKIHQ